MQTFSTHKFSLEQTFLPPDTPGLLQEAESSFTVRSSEPEEDWKRSFKHWRTGKKHQSESRLHSWKFSCHFHRPKDIFGVYVEEEQAEEELDDWMMGQGEESLW